MKWIRKYKKVSRKYIFNYIRINVNPVNVFGNSAEVCAVMSFAFNKKVLPSGGLKYWTDSKQYEKLGGVPNAKSLLETRKVRFETKSKIADNAAKIQ